MIQFQIVIDTRQATQTLQKLEKIDYRPALVRCGEYQVKSTKQNFYNERSPDGQRWKELAPLTIKKKGHSRILRDKDVMINSNEYIIQGNTVIIRNTDKKALFHQKGTKNIPKREFIGFSATNVKRINEIFNKYYQQQIK